VNRDNADNIRRVVAEMTSDALAHERRTGTLVPDQRKAEQNAQEIARRNDRKRSEDGRK